jgi:hypothetical protein
MKKIEFTVEQAIALLPKKVSLTYIDYDDNLDDQQDLVQKMIINNESWNDELEGCFWEQEAYSVREILKELKSDIENELSEFDDDEVEEFLIQFMDDNEDELRDAIYDRNDSDPIGDLLKKSEFNAFYDTGYYMEDGSWSWNKWRQDKEIGAIKKHLGIKGKVFDEQIRNIVQNASYGGNLEVYFNMDRPMDFMNGKDYKSIVFTDVSLGVVNHGNGSGYVEDEIACEIKLPFVRENIILEKTVKYNWSYQIAGMCRHWQNTNVELCEDEVLGGTTIEVSDVVALKEREIKLNKTFNDGGCTHGDMDINRHRNVGYQNTPPMCGNKCPSCGTFWID